jgi:U3 small nucleolar RNA-associated protein 21
LFINIVDAFVTFAKSLSPSAIDLEIRSFTIDPELSLLNYYLDAIYYMLQTRKNFELAQAWLSVFLNIHGDLIVANPTNPIHQKLKDILDIQNNEFGRLSQQIHYSLCLIDFTRRT